MRNEILYNSLRDFVKATCQFLSIATKGVIPTSSKESLTINKDGYSVDLISVPNLNVLIWEFRDQLTKMPETVKVTSIILNEPAFEKPKIYDSRGNLIDNPDYNPFIFVGLHGFLNNYFNAVNDLNYNPDTFTTIYNDYENFFYTKNVRYKVYVLLSNFEMDIDKLTLLNCVELRRASLQEIEEAFSQETFGISKSIPKSKIPLCKYVLAVEYESNKPIPNLLNCLEEPLRILRVFKQGSFGHGLA